MGYRTEKHRSKSWPCPPPCEMRNGCAMSVSSELSPSVMCLFTGNARYLPICLPALLIPLLPIGLTIAPPCYSSCLSHMCLIAAWGNPLLQFTNRSARPAIASRRYRCNSEAEHWPIPTRKRKASIPVSAETDCSSLKTRVGHVYMLPLSRSIDIGL